MMVWSLTRSRTSWSVKWASGSITMNKASGGDGIPVELLQILKNDAVKVLHSICQQIWKTQQCNRTGKGQFSFQSQRKAMPKKAQTTAQLHSSHTLRKPWQREVTEKREAGGLPRSSVPCPRGREGIKPSRSGWNPSVSTLEDTHFQQDISRFRRCNFLFFSKWLWQ